MDAPSGDALIDGSEEDMADMKAVDDMLKRAIAAHMEVEVVISFAQHVSHGIEMSQAAWMAAYDWDC